MKKFIFTILFALLCAGALYAARVFIEGTDYSVDFVQNEDGRAAVLHINFTDAEPTPQEAELLLKDQLKIYGKIIEDERIAKNKEEAEAKSKEKIKTVQISSAAAEAAIEEKYKNIVGSVWFLKDLENPVKIKFNDYLAAYAYIGKTQKIVQFPEYITFLKKERDAQKAKDKLKAAVEKSTEVKTDSQE
ncbi:MAG: hypothetical protein LBO62_01905 [Endomicrobium sp.]|jgi:hypothetical protein|nr:hypothetical protein [Endomicrobium sp.]